MADANSTAPMSPRQLKRLTAAILAAGFAGAIIIYATASPPPPNPLGYDPLETKKYVHDLELYGGKANVLAEEFREWFVGLWQGRNLAFTVAVMTVLLVLVVRFFATPLPPAPPGDAPTEANLPALRLVTARFRVKAEQKQLSVEVDTDEADDSDPGD